MIILKGKEKDVVILYEPAPTECGGTTATLDKSAPKVIKSNDMVLFCVNSKLNTANHERGNGISCVSAFAAKTPAGSFLFLQTADCYRENTQSVWALIKDDIFPALDSLTREYDFAKDNGYHSTTHGLPENFGGDVEIEYSSGEEIGFSDNQSPVISYEAGVKIAGIFGDYLRRERVPLPDISGLKEIRFSEEREPGFTEATLKIQADGSAVNRKAEKYDGNDIFESEKTVDKCTVTKIKEIAEGCGILAWRFLPESEFTVGGRKKLDFVFCDGTEIGADNCKVLPGGIRGGFFDIELEMTTKN